MYFLMKDAQHVLPRHNVPFSVLTLLGMVCVALNCFFCHPLQVVLSQPHVKMTLR